MPQNFTNQVAPVRTPDVMRPDLGGRDDASGALISRGAKSLEDLGKVMGEARDVKAAEAFNTAVDLGGPATEAYYKKRNEYFNGMANAGDARASNEFARKLDDLVAGRDQAVFTPMDAQIRIDNLTKEYSKRLPHLSSYFRSAASSGKGNTDAALREMYGEDPVQKARNALIMEANTKGVPVQQVILEKRQASEHEINKQNYESILMQDTINAKQGFIALNTVVASHMAQRNHAMIQTLQNQLRLDPNTTDGDIAQSVAAAHQQDMAELNLQVARFQAETGTAMTPDQVSGMTKQIDSFYDIFSKELGAFATVEQKLKWLKTRNDMGVETGRMAYLDFAKGQGDLLSLLAGSSPDTAAKFIEAASATKAVYDRLEKANAQATPEQNDAAFTEQFKDQPTMLHMMRLHREGRLEPLISQGIQNIFEGKKVDPSVPSVKIDATKTSINVYDGLPYEQRKGNTASFAAALDFPDYKHSKALMQDARNDPAAASIMLEEATNYSSAHLGVPGTATEMMLDFSNPNAPLQYRTPPSSIVTLQGMKVDVALESQSLKKVNEVFRTLRDGLGADVAKRWLTDLQTSKGIKPKWDTEHLYPYTGTKGGTGRASPKATPEQKAAQKELLKQVPASETALKLNDDEAKVLMNEMLAAHQELGLTVPPNAVVALAQHESSLGKNLEGPDTEKWGRARGAFQIIKAKFDEINASEFGGKLDWNNNQHTSLAGLKLFDQIYNSNGGNLTATFNEYHSGTPTPGQGSRDVNQTTAEYTQQLMDLVSGNVSGEPTMSEAQKRRLGVT